MSAWLDGDAEWEAGAVYHVKSVLARRFNNETRQLEFLVKWKDQHVTDPDGNDWVYNWSSDEYDSWVAASDLDE